MDSRFATDSQALTINWPSRKRRFPVVFQHLCTAHARWGFIMEASFQLDPDISPEEAEAQALAANEDQVSAFRRHARIWTKTEFDAYLTRLAKAAGLPQVEEYGLPATGSMLRYDVMQFAHAMRLRDHIGETEAPLIFVMDGDAGLKQSFTTVFQPEVSAGRAHLAVIDFEKAMTNDARMSVVADGRTDLCAATGLTHAELSLIPPEFFCQIVDDEVAVRLVGEPVGAWFQYPFPTKSEPNKRVLLLTDHPGMGTRETAKLMRLATLRGVDSYFHRFRSNVRFAAVRRSQRTAMVVSGRGIISTTPSCCRSSSRSIASTTTGWNPAWIGRRRRCGSDWHEVGSMSEICYRSRRPG